MIDQHICKWGNSFGMEMVSLVAKVDQKLADIQDVLTDERVKMKEHIEDASKSGGWHERIATSERRIANIEIMIQKEISIIKQGYWKACVVSGVIGGLVASGSPEFFRFLGKILFGHL